jgi:hypothetical protein
VPPPCYVCKSHHLIFDCLFFSRSSFRFCCRFAGGFSRCYRFLGGGSFQFCLQGFFVAGNSVRVSPDLSFFRFFISFSHVLVSLCEGNNSKFSFYNKLGVQKILNRLTFAKASASRERPPRDAKKKRKGLCVNLCAFASLRFKMKFSYQIFTRALSGLNILSPSFTSYAL